MPRRRASHYRARSIAVAVVIGGHVALLALLATRQEREPGTPADRQMTLVFIDALEETTGPASVDYRARAARPVRVPTIAPAPLPASANDESAAITPGVDWYARGSDIAQRAAIEPTTRDFGIAKREPAPRAKKPFGWDKVHTERVQALEGGGIGIRLSENCQIALIPLPIGGCSFGKRKARGDLFDEMKAPVDRGDWK